MINEIGRELFIALVADLIMLVVALIVATRFEGNRKKIAQIILLLTICILLAGVVGFWPRSNISVVESTDQPLCSNAISTVISNPQTIPVGRTATISVIPGPGVEGAITYIWTAERGRTVPEGETDRTTIDYRAPDITGQDTISVTARTSQCTDTENVVVHIVESSSSPP